MDLGPVDRITADAIGEPGDRTFFLQARAGSELVTIIVEKQQVQLLAASILELLADVPLETEAGSPDDDELGLEEPLDARWRAGRLSLGYDREQDLFLLEVTEFDPREDEDDGDDDDGDDEDDDALGELRALVEHELETVRLLATRAQMLALSRHGAEVAERGRPTCQFCGNPIDPEGHACPAMNGHSAARD